MRKGLRELGLAAAGIGLGVALFVVASGHVYSQRFNGLFSFETWGYPLPWLSLGGEVYVPPTPLGFGLSVDGWVSWSAFYEDLSFWLVVPLAAVELSTHVVVPRLWRALEVRRERREARLASVYGRPEDPE